MFRRTDKSGSATSDTATLEKVGGKGRPTPTRKEAEAATKARARAGTDKGASKKVLRQRRAADNAKVRAGMKSGDERYLPPRDQGPIRRFTRDFIDARLCVGEFLLVLLIVIMGLSASPNTSVKSLGQGLWTATILLTLVDTVWMLWRLRRELKARFPGEDIKGTNFYAIMRMLQLRPMRMPKRKVKLGGKPR